MSKKIIAIAQSITFVTICAEEQSWVRPPAQPAHISVLQIEYHDLYGNRMPVLEETLAQWHPIIAFNLAKNV